MDGDPVTGEPSQDHKEPVSLTETFIKLCPQYMAMGMTYDEFWNCNTKVHKAVREAYELRMKREEWGRWRQAMYIYDTLLRVSPVFQAAFSKRKVEPGKFPDEPWPLTEKEKRELYQ